MTTVAAPLSAFLITILGLHLSALMLARSSLEILLRSFKIILIPSLLISFSLVLIMSAVQLSMRDIVFKISPGKELGPGVQLDFSLKVLKLGSNGFVLC